MISIRDAISDLERAEHRQHQLLDCYSSAIKTAAQYAVEFDQEITEPHRKYLDALAKEVAGGAPEALEGSASTFRSLLRDYRDKAAQYLNHLRQELASSASALQDILWTLNQSDGDHESRLRQEVKRLHEASRCDTLEAMRTVVVTATQSLEQSVEELRRQHQLTVAQFLTEIRALHQRIDSLENAAARDALTQLFNQSEMEKRIRGAQEGAFLLLMRVRGIRRAETQFSGEVSQELAGAFTRRLRNSLKPAAVCGRWGAEQFITIGPPEKDQAVATAKWMSQHLSGNYSCLQKGKSVHPSIDVEVEIIERPPGEDAEPALALVRDYFAA
jgi:GGDEF domain-containing protein